MTQIWPGFGDAPVPTVVSMICKPEAVVMVFPAVWADCAGWRSDEKDASRGDRNGKGDRETSKPETSHLFSFLCTE